MNLFAGEVVETIPQTIGREDAAKTAFTVSAKSTDKKVASVSNIGKVTAKKAGTAVITAKLGTVSTKIQIKVTK